MLKGEDALAERGPCVVTVGAFDGVHLGHQAILSATRDEARARGVASAALTFHPHPAAARGDTGFRYLVSLEDRLELLGRYGMDVVRVMDFTSETAATEAERYVREVIVGVLGARCAVVGPTHRFGRGGTGDVQLLRSLGAELGLDVRVVEQTLHDGAVVSSSRIRAAIMLGDVGSACEMLGRPVTVEGPGVTGFARGRKLGFPTANLIVPEDRVAPAPGVYAGLAKVPAGIYPAGIHIGPVPTYGSDEPSVEAHLLGFDGDLVGARIVLGFLRRIRRVERFASESELAARIQADLRHVREEAARTPFTLA